ncbi:ThuA domain-containing protein [Microbacterium sp. NPDC089189]|uniref:ThuA domain-containing protein n=1 Tax=Microbacterium sp. NPDC089189 TaxID=3154972 RepID=UPI00342D3BBF
MRALIASGAGRYADPWHPFAETSAALAGILGDAGIETVIDDDVDAAMTRLDGIDLLVVNAGDPWRAEEHAERPHPASVDGLAGALTRGMGVLAMHCAVSSLRDYPQWAHAIGRIWVPGGSFHPPADEAAIEGGALPDGTALPSFRLFDERYCRLQVTGETVDVAHPATDPADPSAWVREVGAARIAVDVLGHDARSYTSAGHRQLVTALARWAGRA